MSVAVRGHLGLRADHKTGSYAQTMLVRIVHDASQKLVYIGQDVFWNPRQACGLWTLLGAELADMQATASAMVVDAHIRLALPVHFMRETESKHDGTLYEESVLKAFGWFSYSDTEAKAAAKVKLNRAVELGVVEVVDVGWVSKYRLTVPAAPVPK